MAQVLIKGTAWEKSLEDYAYTRALSSAGWAWEFLRRNEAYQREVRMNRAGHPTAIGHVSGSTLYRLRRRFIAAERWGLSFFCDPSKSALEVSPFWLSELVTHVAYCEAISANDNDEEPLSLASFTGRRAVLAGYNGELFLVTHGIRNASLVVTGGSIAVGANILRFYHKGLGSASRHAETLKILTYLFAEKTDVAPTLASSDSKYCDYLIALDGHLASRSYRDIAEVLYGADRVGATWTGDTQGLKSKVRRAVECGLALMNGGYRDLL